MKGRYTTKALMRGWVIRQGTTKEGWIYSKHQLRGFDIYQRQQGVEYMSKLQRYLAKCDEIKTASSVLFIKLQNTHSISEHSFE